MVLLPDLPFLYFYRAGVIARLHGFCVLKLLHYIHEELLIVLGTSSSDAALPSLMAKMEKNRYTQTGGGVGTATGFSFNMIGTSIYLAMASLFIAQATDTPMNFRTI